MTTPILRQGKRALRHCLAPHRTSATFQERKRALRHCSAQCRTSATCLAQCRTSATMQCSPDLLFPSTSFYRITPSTQTQVVSHDVRAASITKALYIDCLPPGVADQDLDNELHKTFKKTIFETFFFEPTQRHLKSLRKDRKANTVIVEGLYSELLKFLHTKVDTRECKVMVDRDPYFQYPFYRTLPDMDKPAPFLIDGQLTYNVLSNVPATPLFSVEQCEQTREHPVEWPDVIATTLDIEESSLPDNITPGYSAAGLPKYPYTRVLLDIAPGSEWSDTSRARGIHFLFARLASEAVRDGYQPGDTLETPRVAVYISSSAYSYHFVFYQLNTLDLLSGEGVKNLAWGQTVENITSNLMPYRKVTPENLLGPALLEEVCDLAKLALLYDLPLREGTFVE